MKLSHRLEAAAAEVFAREIKNKAAPDDHFWFVDATTSNLLLEAAEVVRSVESAPVGTVDPLTHGGFGVIVTARDMIGQRVALVPLPQQSET